VSAHVSQDRLTDSGAAIWTAVIAKTSFVESVKVQGGTSLGIQVNAGGTLCEFLLPSASSFFSSFSATKGLERRLASSSWNDKEETEKEDGENQTGSDLR
jgi:hypothetical protein